MNRNSLYLVAVFLLLFTVSGCIGEDAITQPVPEPSGGQCLSPKVMIGEICCYDQNQNGVCDMDDGGCPDSCDDSDDCTLDYCNVTTSFECKHKAVPDCCGNGICDESEDVANVCPEDCTVLDITDFGLTGEKAYVVGDTFEFIHTVGTDPQKNFYLSITAGNYGMEDISYTFKCNSTQHKDLDSINSEVSNYTDDIDDKVNKLEDDYYIIYTNFKKKNTGVYSRSIDVLNAGEVAYFNFNIEKKDPQKRDDLSCLVKLYFLSPQKVVDKWLYISYI